MASEVGLLRAVGFGPGDVRRLFLGEGILLALAAVRWVPGCDCLRRTVDERRCGSWWVDAVGTEALTLHVSIFSLLAGAVGGIAAAVACIWWTLRSLASNFRAEPARGPD